MGKSCFHDTSRVTWLRLGILKELLNMSESNETEEKAKIAKKINSEWKWAGGWRIVYVEEY
jgi:hypothetical protein